MWDWSGSKNPPPSKGRDLEAEEALEQGITPSFRPVNHGYRRDPRIINYGDSKDKLESSMYGIPPHIPVHAKEESNKAPWTLNELSSGSSVAPSDPSNKLDSSNNYAPFSIVEPSGDASIWEWQLSQFNLPGMSLVEVEINPIDVNTRGELRRAFKRARRDFLRYIAYYNEQEIFAAGIDENGLRSLKRGKAPENFDVHLKIPFEYSGSNDFSNLILIQTHSYHEDLHKFIDMQTTSQPYGCKLKKLYIPVASGKVYLPKDSSVVGGGKGKGDKTAVSGYSEGALQQIAIKSSIGRSANI